MYTWHVEAWNVFKDTEDITLIFGSYFVTCVGFCCYMQYGDISAQVVFSRAVLWLKQNLHHGFFLGKFAVNL